MLPRVECGKFYARYAASGAPPDAPALLFGLLLYGYCTGVFSSRKIARATYDSLAFRSLAGGRPPDHDTIAHFRRQFLDELKDMCVQVLWVAQAVGELTGGHVSVDGSKIHADASKSKAVSHKRLLERARHLRQAVDERFKLAASAEMELLPEGVNPNEAMVLRQVRLARLARARTVLEARADGRYQADLAAYQAKVREREDKARQRGRKPGGRPPRPPVAGPRDTDQYPFTDPESQIMNNSKDGGFAQHYNAQGAVEQETFLSVANTLSNHANDTQEAVPTVDAIDPRLGTPAAGALDNGYVSESNILARERRGIKPYLATGRAPHHKNWREFFAPQPLPPEETASATEKMAYTLRTAIGKKIYGVRQCTVEPVLGILKETLGCRQFSLRGLKKVAGEWNLVCCACNVKRLDVLQG